jgi:hypothetical protein
MTPLNENQTPARSHLFTVRVWLEELGDGQVEWRGQVQHVMSGQTRYFRDWSTLLAFLQGMLPGVESRLRDETI